MKEILIQRYIIDSLLFTKTKFPRMYGQPKVRKADNLLREIGDSTGSVAKETDTYISRALKKYVQCPPPIIYFSLQMWQFSLSI